MHLLSRALVRVRAVFFGPPEPESDRTAHEPDTAPAPVPSMLANHLSPEMWAAFLASARRHRGRTRTRCPRPQTELPDITTEDIASTLVGAYVLTPEVRQQLRQVRQFAEVC
ncbi:MULTISPECIES: hypothetical protein [Streptomyces]|uniref:hypothetical protein n=1 Tax=Streptomyces TaxID=1883 RepID=UPI0008ED0880|nr:MULTISPECIES: hypothetical protein [unclassified Streptomyces]SFN22479.1 hypothetical protein SAMN04487980_10148 [Streptomyces sp. cf124]